MIYKTPTVSAHLARQIEELSRLRRELEQRGGRPIRWMGSLRREIRAAAIVGSTSIEGFSVAPAEAVQLVERRSPPGDDDNQQAVACYARAMDHVGAMAADPHFRWLDRVILDLHFDACYFQKDKDPGLWRTAPIGVTAADGSLEFRGPEAEKVVPLMAEVIEWLARDEPGIDVAVRAAMAHLNVISVHPFRDGNGRVSRIVQSLVLALGGAVAPELFSIEEYLGHHTQAYYAVLREVQRGGYQPERDATPWVEFCIEAHLAQARQRLGQIERAAARWERLEAVIADRRWPERLIIALEQSLTGRTDRRRYSEEAGISAATASADFRRLLDAGLLRQRGQGRSVAYEPSEQLLNRVGSAEAG